MNVDFSSESIMAGRKCDIKLEKANLPIHLELTCAKCCNNEM